MIRVLLLTAAIITANPSNIKLLTDNTPDWSDLNSAAKSITASFADDEQKALALLKYVSQIRHQVPPAKDSFSIAAVPPAHPQYGIIYNPIKLAHNYGNTFCVSTNSIVPLMWKKLGKESREFDIVGHTVCDLKYGNEWHHFDAAFGFAYKDTATGKILSCPEVVARNKTNVPSMMCDFTYCNRLDTAKSNACFYQNTRIHNILNRTEEYAKIESVRETLFTEKYSDSYSYNLTLKPFESYTRYFNQIADSLKYYLPVSEADPKNPNAVQSPYLNVVANGVWRFVPDLSSKELLQTLAFQKNLASVNALLQPENPKDTAELIYRANAANIICHAEIKGSFERLKEKSFFEVLFSADSINWISLYRSEGKNVTEKSFDIPFGKNDKINLARTRTHYFIKIKLKAAKKSEEAVLRTLSITTYTIVNPRTLPALTLGSNRVKFESGTGNTSNVALSFHWSEARADGEAFKIKSRSFGKLIKNASEEWLINTAGLRNPTMDSITLSYTPVSNIKDGYSDNEDVGAAFEAGKYFYTFGKCISSGKAVTALPSTDSLITLTDNIAGPRQFGATWPKGSNPVLTMTFDGKKGTPIAGTRILQALPDQNSDYFDSCVISTSRDNKTFKRAGAVTKRQVYDQVTNFLWQNSWDQPVFNNSRNRNIARYKFSSVFDTPDSVKSIRFSFFNSISPLRLEEIELYDKMTKSRVINEIDNGFKLPDPSALKE
ncbi:MAG: hypothetical protein JNL74_02605 [Fibrobacteres bacterium]|nr:hypothetical protein [Fibrobacterota bacterium]